jgi:uncharacterized protein
VQRRLSRIAETNRDRDAEGRARNSRRRDDLGRPMPRDAGSLPPTDPPALTPTEAVSQAQQLLDRGQPFAAHEVFEAVWKATADPGERELWRGLAQLCVGITHALRGNEIGAAALLQRAAETLAPYAGTTPYDIDVDGLRAWASRGSGDVERAHGAPRLTVDVTGG